MASLAILSEELILSILPYLQTVDLLSLTRVCKSLQRITAPRIYQGVNCTWDEDTEDISSIQLFLRSILERPELALLVKHVQFQGINHTEWRHLELGDHVIKLARNLISRAQFPLADTWMLWGIVDPIIALVLSQLSNLESLEVGIVFMNDQPFVRKVINAAISHSLEDVSTPAFRSLQKIEYSAMPGVSMIETSNIDRILPLFYLPSIRTISTLIRDADLFSWPQKDCPHASSLTTLNLHYAHMKESTLKELLSTTPNLRTLLVGFQINAEPHDTHSPFLNITKLRDALDQVRSTLEHLTLSIDFFTTVAMELDWGGSYENGNNFGVRGSLGSLATFENLQSIEIPLILLFGWSSSPPIAKLADMLPRTLRTIVLRNDLALFQGYDWEQAKCPRPVLEWLCERRSYQPKLERVTMRMKQYMGENDWGKDARGELERCCEGAGVAGDFCEEEYW